MELYGVERSHFHVVQLSIPVHVNTSKPVADGYFIRFVLFAKHEKDEVFIVQVFLGFICLAKRSWRRIKDAINNHVRQTMISIFEKVFPSDPIVAIMVKFPESAV
jgi:hypothetical protein